MKLQQGWHTVIMGGVDLVGNPHRLVGGQRVDLLNIGKLIAANQIVPVIGADQVKVAQPEFLRLVAEVVHRENALVAGQALPPEGKQRQVQRMQGVLGGVGVKGRLLASNFNQPLQLGEHLGVGGGGVGQGSF